MPGELRGDEPPEGYGSPAPIPYRDYAPAPPLPGIPPYPNPGGTIPLRPVLKRSRAWRWIALSVLVVLLLAGVTSFFVIRYLNRSTPDKTLDAFCNALQQANYQSAYDQFSAKLQHTISESTFATALSQDKVTACTHGTSGDSGSSVTNNLKLVHASKGINNDIVTLVQVSNNDWKIDNVYRQT